MADLKTKAVKAKALSGLPRLVWTPVRTVHGKSNNIPESSGIYAYGEVIRIGGLPVQTRWVYVGKSKNLRTRIGFGHDARRETNTELKSWLKKSKINVELWFAPVAQDELDSVEKQMIFEIQPDFNRNLK